MLQQVQWVQEVLKEQAGFLQGQQASPGMEESRDPPDLRDQLETRELQVSWELRVSQDLGDLPDRPDSRATLDLPESLAGQGLRGPPDPPDPQE